MQMSTLCICIGTDVITEQRKDRSTYASVPLQMHNAARHLNRHRHRCKAMKRSLDIYIDTNVNTERRKDSSSSASAPTQMQSDKRVARHLHRH
ncbi:hypothetical protein BHE74_00006396 [Ensete ventricosum]|uniref:Uncharacterized protein n=1 Tax=Ensete ventricosum TaxID=4639 RepID=A0A444E0X5_ENSVE|nr:hypothetical protein GW17_00032759 [Ensete ventricosum]RWW84965.1 hypothetical protein BHE74_00006396 [Ensete ventricosum]RZR72084.1 hypothetical protein BHM03_00010258 [Ensete ventricosum]